MGRLAIIAGRGVLPRMLAAHCAQQGTPCLIVTFNGFSADWMRDHPRIDARFEKLGELFEGLRVQGCDRVVFAGGMDRPGIDPTAFDTKTLALAPRIFGQLGKGDDALLRAIAKIFAEEGLEVIAAHDVLPALLASGGLMTRKAPSADDLADISRARELVAMLGAQDVGQGAVVAQGLCLGLETLQGTDRMLEFVAHSAQGLRPDPHGARGVLFKAPKPGQDRRMDLPAIGPGTVERAQAAGLAGIAVVAGGVMLLERKRLLALADEAGLFVFGVAPNADPNPDSDTGAKDG